MRNAILQTFYQVIILSCKTVGSWSLQVPELHSVYDQTPPQISSASGKMAKHQLEKHLQHVRKCLICFFITFLNASCFITGFVRTGLFRKLEVQERKHLVWPQASYRPHWLRWQGDTAVPPSIGCVSSTSHWPAGAAIKLPS